MSLLVEQILTSYSNPDGQRKTITEVVTPQRESNSVYPRAFYHNRTPMVITTRSWLSTGDYIKCFCNPINAGWSLPRRESLQKTASGVVRNTWRNRYRNSYIDAFPVQFSFQSGNIMPSAPYDPSLTTIGASSISEPVLPAGLDNFYRFMSLVDEPALGNSQANYHILVYHSRIFPELWLEGWFQPEGITWRDEGNFVNWEASLLVTRTVPKLTSYSLMAGLYSDWVKNNALSEAVPPNVLAPLQKQMRLQDALTAYDASLPRKGAAAQDPSKVGAASSGGASVKTKPGAANEQATAGQPNYPGTVDDWVRQCPPGTTCAVYYDVGSPPLQPGTSSDRFGGTPQLGGQGGGMPKPLTGPANQGGYSGPFNLGGG